MLATSMGFTPEEAKKIATWLEARYRACPNCGAKSGGFTDVIGLPVQDELETGHMHRSLTVLPVSCGKCGYVSLFNAKPLLEPNA